MGEMNLKILASDYDGTLFFGEEEPNFRERDIKAIQEFQKAGNLFGICTGRPYQGITSFKNVYPVADFSRYVEDLS